MSQQAKEYSISKIADFLAVPESSIGGCLADFATWLAMARAEKAINEEMNAIFGGGVTLSTDSFVFVDDGQRGLSALDFVTPEGDSMRVLGTANTGNTGKEGK